MQRFRLKEHRIEIVLFYVLAAADLIVAAFYDLKIDIALNNTSSFLANWFAQTGEMPASLLLIAAAAVLAKCLGAQWLKAVSALACVGAGGYFGDFVSRRLFAEGPFRFGYGILFGVGTALTALLALHFIQIPAKLKKPLIALSLAAVCGCAAQTLLIHGMKTLWGRVRFRDLDAAYSAFTPWFTVNGNTGDHSFPSGHTGSAGMSYYLMALPYVSKKWKKYRAAGFAIAFAYTVAVAATRLVMGAHYLSDVTVGGTIAFSCVLLSLLVYEKICAKKGWLP